MQKPFVPPGGFAGFSAQVPAVQALVQRPATRRKKRKKTTVRKKRATRRTRAAPKRRTRTTRSRKPARLVKGSAAAKRHMAKLRKMRGRGKR